MKNVLITGASKGIGKAIALTLAKENYNLILNYNNSYDEVIELENSLKQYNIKTLIIKADVSNELEVKNMVEKAIEEFKTIDVLINNAGICKDTLFIDKTVEDFRRILDVNLIGPFLVSKYVSKYMLENKNGRIINIASNNGIDSYYPESCDYDASKAGLINLTYNLANELSPIVHVNAVAPGWINTEMNKELSEEQRLLEERKILLNRFGEPSEVANVVSFLISDKASYINGTVIKVDGGKNVC